MGKKNLYKYCCTESEVEVVVHVEGKWRGTGFFQIEKFDFIYLLTDIECQGRSNSKSMGGAQLIQHLSRILKNIALHLINSQN